MSMSSILQELMKTTTPKGKTETMNNDNTHATLSNGWLVGVENITPSYASILLTKNEGNRPIKKSVRSKYAATMAAGNWKLSPDGIIISKAGNLLQGQHRLSAVVMSGKTIPFFVCRNVEDGVFSVLDRGATRSVADALRIERRLAEVSRFALTLVAGRHFTMATFTDQELEEVAGVFEEPHSMVMAACNSPRKVFTSVPFRAAASLRILSGTDSNWVCGLYRNMALGHVSDLHASAQNFFGGVVSGRIKPGGGGQNQTEMFARAWDLFNPDKMNASRIVIRDREKVISEAKVIICAALGR